MKEKEQRTSAFSGRLTARAEAVTLASANAGIKKLQKVCLCLENLKS